MTKKQKTEKELDTKTSAEKAVAMTEERMVANIRDNFYDANRVLWITGEINDEEQYDVIKWLHYYNDKSGLPVTIYINSFGGSIYTMNAILDLIEELKTNGVVVNTVCIGMAMSAASLILAAGSNGHRFISPRSIVMLHSIQSFLGDNVVKTKDVSIHAKFTEKLQAAYEQTLADYTGKTLKEIKRAVEYENYLNAEEAVEFGVVDKVDLLIV